METCKIETDLKGQFLIWFEVYSKVLFDNSEVLLEDSYCFCTYNGKITVFESKQVDYETNKQQDIKNVKKRSLRYC